MAKIFGNRLLIFVRRISSNNSNSSPVRVRNPINLVFGKYLCITNTLSCGVLMLLGDLFEQEFENFRKKTNKLDYGRLTRMFIVGLTMGPVHHYYYKYINRLFPRRDLTHVGYKIAADQFIMSPICIAQFFYTLDYLEGRTLEESNKEFKHKFWKVYTVDWCVWPPVQCINFYLVPSRFQVIYINAATMLYNVFLSYMKHVKQ